MAYIPKKWANIRSIQLKSEESVALSIYRALPRMGFKIDNAFQKKPVACAADEDVSGEVIQSQKREEKGQEKELGSQKRRQKQGMIREVRYMDTNLDDVLLSDDGNISEEGEDEWSGEEMVKGSKKRKKDAKMSKTGAQGSGEGAEVNGVKKGGSKGRTTDDSGAKSKVNKKVQLMDTNLNDDDFTSGLLSYDGGSQEEGEDVFYGEKKDTKKWKKDAKKLVPNALTKAWKLM